MSYRITFKYDSDITAKGKVKNTGDSTFELSFDGPYPIKEFLSIGIISAQVVEVKDKYGKTKDSKGLSPYVIEDISVGGLKAWDKKQRSLSLDKCNLDGKTFSSKAETLFHMRVSEGTTIPKYIKIKYTLITVVRRKRRPRKENVSKEIVKSPSPVKEESCPKEEKTSLRCLCRDCTRRRYESASNHRDLSSSPRHNLPDFCHKEEIRVSPSRERPCDSQNNVSRFTITKLN